MSSTLDGLETFSDITYFSEEEEILDMKNHSDTDRPENDCDRRQIAIQRIEKFVLSFLTQLSASLPPPVLPNHEQYNDRHTDSHPSERDGKYDKYHRPTKIEFHLANRRKIQPDGSFGVRKVCYPRNSRGPSAKPLAQLFRILELMHEGLVNDTPVTKRDIYYKDVPLFGSQAVVDRLVDDLAATFDLERSDLNVCATSKGLVCGVGLTIHLVAGETVHLNDTEGTLIPPGEKISYFEVTEDVSWVLIVEKDAVFQTLCQLRLANHSSVPGRGIIITGKGYPDMATRQLVKSLSDNLPLKVPILALVDGDPYGIDILSVYKYGSQALQHENEKLAAERVEWIGVWASELASLDIDRDTLIPIQRQDEKKALSMLRRPSRILPMKWRKELMYILHTRCKAEIEIITSFKLPSPSLSFSLGHSPSDTTAPDYYPQEDSASSLTSTSAARLLGYLSEKISYFVSSGV